MRQGQKVINLHDDAVMSFEEIGARLGMTRGGAWMAYKSAIAKLRRTPRRLRIEAIRELAKTKGKY